MEYDICHLVLRVHIYIATANLLSLDLAKQDLERHPLLVVLSVGITIDHNPQHQPSIISLGHLSVCQPEELKLVGRIIQSRSAQGTCRGSHQYLDSAALSAPAAHSSFSISVACSLVIGCQHHVL